LIQAMIFDLDGTLVQTERLKAISYARAIHDLCPNSVAEDEVIAAFKDVVGLPRREVALALVERFDLEQRAEEHLEEFGVASAWQAFVQIRLKYYAELLSDPQLLIDNQWPHNRELLRTARRQGCKTALATMSRCEQAMRVLDSLKLHAEFDFVATRDDVEMGKPDPEIYHLVAGELGVLEKECLVIEDSPSGVRAALSAGMRCIAVTTPFTENSIHEQGLLDERWIVDDPVELSSVVQDIFVQVKG
jgi:HAD superfamily hydrolase (TIGR01509 family)